MCMQLTRVTTSDSEQRVDTSDTLTYVLRECDTYVRDTCDIVIVLLTFILSAHCMRHSSHSLQSILFLRLCGCQQGISGKSNK